MHADTYSAIVTDYNWNRYYDPGLGVYTQTDKITEISGGRYLDSISYNPEIYGAYTYAALNPMGYVDWNGLSPRDVREFRKYLDEIVELYVDAGIRRPGKGWINGALNNLGILLGQDDYLGCKDQALITKPRFENFPTDDKWTFSVEGYLGHRWIRAESNNRDDPILRIDPWKGYVELD